jgi:hypothetical protein
VSRVGRILAIHRSFAASTTKKNGSRCDVLRGIADDSTCARRATVRALLAIGTAGSLPVRRTAEGLERIRAAMTTRGRRRAEVERMRVMVRLVELT